MRQKDDKIFAIALSNIAKGMMTLEDINLLKSRIVSDENLKIMEDAIRVFRSNAEVDAYNTKVIYGKKSSELLILIQNEKFLRTIFNELYHQMQRQKLYNLHMITYLVALVFVLKIDKI